MQIKAEQLEAALQKQLHSLYVLQGDEPLLLQEAIDAIRGVARSQGFGQRMAYTVSGAGFDWASVLGAVNSFSLFSDKQIVELHIPSGKPGREGEQVLPKLVDSVTQGEGSLLIVTLPHLDKKTQSTEWFKALSQQAVNVAIASVPHSALPGWIAERLRRQGQHVAAGIEGEQALKFFADRVEGNLLAAHQEIQKLGLLHPHGELSAQQIEASVLNVARYDVFKLSEAVLAGNLERTQRMLDGLQAEGVSEVLVHYTLAEDIRALKRVRDSLDKGKPLPMVLQEQRIWGMRQRLFERVIDRVPTIALAGLLHSAHVVDGIVKGIKVPDWPADSWQALHRLAFQLCKLAATPPNR